MYHTTSILLSVAVVGAMGFGQERDIRQMFGMFGGGGDNENPSTPPIVQYETTYLPCPVDLHWAVCGGSTSGVCVFKYENIGLLFSFVLLTNIIQKSKKYHRRSLARLLTRRGRKDLHDVHKGNPVLSQITKTISLVTPTLF